MGVFGDMRKETFAALVAALILLLLLYLELYRWEGVHLAVTAYEPAPPYVATNFSTPGASIRQRMRHIIESSQQQKLRGGQRSNDQKCPEWYSIIREDFKPWSDRQGITPVALFNAWPLAHFRFQIVDGELFVERNWQMMQFKYMEYLRFYYTVWGILQLLERYPGQVPNVDVMMETFDHPLVDKYQWEMDMDPPPLLKYCGTPNHWDITWPDWSFWGWAELEIPPWQLQLDAITQTNKTDWEKRPGHAFWQGGSEQCVARKELWKCEDNEKLRWGVELRHVDWGEGKMVDHKLLENQCQHKFKLYMEGWAWSASGKYILACDATTLMVESEWYEFWYRGLKPGVNFLPVAKAPNLCANIRKTVDWGRAHPRVAKQIGRAGTEFLMREVNMPLVYDYMLHVLREYASLQTFKVQPSQYALKVTTKTWLKDAFDERNSESDLPHGLRYFPEVLRPGISPEKVRAQLLVEERAERPPCVVDWGHPERPALDPRDTVGSIPAGLLREFEELARREEEDRRLAEEREREEALAKERTEKAAQKREAVLAREHVKERRSGVDKGVKRETDGLGGVAQATEPGGGAVAEAGGKLLGDKILGDLERKGGTTEAEDGVDDIVLTVKPLTLANLRGKGYSRVDQATDTVANKVVETGSEGLDVRLKKKPAPGKGG